MNVKKILKTACDFLGLDGLKTQIDSENISTEHQKLLQKLLDYLNLIEEEIATEFLKLSHKEKVSSEDKILFSQLNKTILEVISVKDQYGRKLPFRVYPDHVSFKGKAEEIVYNFIPNKAELEGDVEFLVPLRVYAYGIAREYFLFEGLVDKATMFENRFKCSIENLLRKDKNVIMPSKRWL